MESIEKTFPIKTEEASLITGFDIELDKEKLKHIDHLVDDYEKSILMHVDAEYNGQTTWSDRLADKIALFGGSWKFIISFLTLLIFWVIWNILPFTGFFHFDGPPFILLNLLLSLLAAFQAPIILMSQNRQSAKDKHESIIDFAVNYKSEEEINDIQEHLHTIQHQMIELDKKLSVLLEQTNENA